MYPATVSDFRLDRFEVTVGRFRAFVEAGMGTQQNPPAAGTGANPKVAGSGWDATWNAGLPADKAALTSALGGTAQYPGTWTELPSVNETLVMVDVSWYLSVAFCGWDGGWLPSEAQWNYAAAAGGVQRQFPWGNNPANSDFASYDCLADSPIPVGSCTGGTVTAVGAHSPKGDAYWGQADMAGNAREWVRDLFSKTYPIPCSDCENLSTGTEIVARGGGADAASTGITTFARFSLFGSFKSYAFPTTGARCARQP